MTNECFRRDTYMYESSRKMFLYFLKNIDGLKKRNFVRNVQHHLQSGLNGFGF